MTRKPVLASEMCILLPGEGDVAMIDPDVADW